jgi:hypothetical protein
VYNILGQEMALIVNEEKDSGVHEAKFNAINLPSGIYFYRFKSEHFNGVGKMIVVK